MCNKIKQSQYKYVNSIVVTTKKCIIESHINPWCTMYYATLVSNLQEQQNIYRIHSVSRPGRLPKSF